MLLLGGTLNAHADNAVYDNITRHPRGDDVLQADTDDGSQMLGAPQSGTPTPQAYKGCMRGRAGATATRCASAQRVELLEFLSRTGNASPQGVARRPPCMKTPGGWNGPGRRAPKSKVR
jgi:hypothetical protein